MSKNGIEVLKEISAEVLGQHSSISDVTWGEIAKSHKKNDYICAKIPISGQEIDVTFSTYFIPDDAIGYVEGKKLDKQISKDFVIDFFREYCNLIYGEYKRVFNNAGLEIDQSLPESYIDRNHKFHTSREHSADNHSFWKLLSAGGTLYIGLKFDEISLGLENLTRSAPEEEIV